jgi:hypothetical protein
MEPTTSISVRRNSVSKKLLLPRLFLLRSISRKHNKRREVNESEAVSYVACGSPQPNNQGLAAMQALFFAIRERVAVQGNLFISGLWSICSRRFGHNCRRAAQFLSVGRKMIRGEVRVTLSPSPRSTSCRFPATHRGRPFRTCQRRQGIAQIVPAKARDAGRL